MVILRLSVLQGKAMKRDDSRLVEILALIIGAILILGFLIPILTRKEHHTPEARCSRNLRALGRVMQLYANDYDDRYPTADKWCDLLSKHTNIASWRFVCQEAGEGKCHYAINPNTSPNSPPDMVLLFETEGGWNRFGGVELATTHNHAGFGCNILFNDGHVGFIKKKHLGELNWGGEQK